MSGQDSTHDGVVAFQPLSPGRESIMLGLVQVGEISPTLHPSSRAPTCFRLMLPGVSSRPWHPAQSIEDARRLAAAKIGDWIEAAGLTPATRRAS
ncbi:hypothetical protein [Bradyrhizobium sp. SZCCHNRI2049]|uniref:hypothetical protein n=1 Tax=Bradyrhizobium sp. SZCCHNRI2049 TaxID=3057287 RepID=UPI00291633F2|nr:hypothetical protein [Bradyrhizobium sp. SZCCHNRI2049]